MNRIIWICVVLVLAIVAASSSMYIVDQRDYALVLEFEKVTKVVSDPGLHFKWPYPINQIVLIDRRIQTIDRGDTDRYITAEKKNLLVDLFVKWRITDPLKFYISFRNDQDLAQDRLTQLIRAALNEEFTKRTVREVISSQRENVMQGVRTKVASDAAAVGITIIDVRLKRVDLLAGISDSVYRRMQAERNRVANELRSIGGAEAEQIKADADRQRVVILADAYQKAQNIKGEGDAHASQIYAEAFGRDPKFYDFYKSLEAYRASFGNHGDLLIVDPSSEFFKYMKQPGAGAPGKK